MQKQKILYIDMDNVIVDFKSGIDKLSPEIRAKYEWNFDEVPGIFATMKPLPDAIESVMELTKYYSTFILSTAPWYNSTAWSDKIEWIHSYFGKDSDSPLFKRLILSHNKNLNKWDFLIDDRTANWAWEFEWELIQFGSEKFPNWKTVLEYLLSKK